MSGCRGTLHCEWGQDIRLQLLISLYAGPSSFPTHACILCRISDDGLDTVQPMPPSGPPPAPAPAPGHALPVKPGAGTSGVVPALQLTKLPLMATPQSIQAADEEMQMLSARWVEAAFVLREWH